MLPFCTLLLMIGLAYAFSTEGIFTSFSMFCNTFLAGLIAFNFWEPLADVLDPLFHGSFMEGYEDWLAMVGIFALALGFFRTVSNLLDNTLIEFDPHAQKAGGAVLGLLTGYLLAGFLICAYQTLPWDQRFLGFQPRLDPNAGDLAHLFPPDRVWLALMHRAGEVPLATDGPSFDDSGTFELRYERFRRIGESGTPAPYNHEFDRELHGTGGASP